MRRRHIPAPYRPRDSEQAVLHAIIREHLEPFLREVSERSEGNGLPRFVALLLGVHLRQLYRLESTREAEHFFSRIYGMAVR